MDREFIARREDHSALRIWLRLLTCTQLIERRVRSGLREAFGTTLPRFDLMAQLERHREGLKMNELSRLLMVTGGNVTAIVDQLEKEGLVRLADGLAALVSHRPSSGGGDEELASVVKLVEATGLEGATVAQLRTA